MSYTVTAPLVVARREDGSYVHVYEKAPLPEDIDKEQLKQLVESKMVEKVKATTAKSPAGDKPDGPADGNVDEVLKRVGDDQEKAKAALEAENAKGDKARSSLVEKLEEIANPSSGD